MGFHWNINGAAEAPPVNPLDKVGVALKANPRTLSYPRHVYFPTYVLLVGQGNGVQTITSVVFCARA